MLVSCLSSKATATTLLFASLLCYGALASPEEQRRQQLTLHLVSTDAPTADGIVPSTNRQAGDDMQMFDELTTASSPEELGEDQKSLAEAPESPSSAVGKEDTDDDLNASDNASSSIQEHEVVLDIHSIHYTSCLMNKRDDQEDQLPLFARDTTPVVLKDDDDNEYYIVIYSSVSGELANSMGLPAVEFCHAVLTENTGRLGEAVPEANKIQSSRCFGLNAPGYDAHKVEVQYSKSAVGVTPHVELNGNYLYSQTPIPHTPVDLTRTIDNVYLDTFHTHYADAPNPDVNSTSPYYGYFMRVYNQLPATIHVTPVSPSLSTGFNTFFDSNADPSDIHSCLSFESYVAAGDNIVPLATIVGQFNTGSTPDEFFASFDKESMRSALKLDKQELGNYQLEDTIFDVFSQYVHPFGAAGFEFDWMSKFRTVTAILDIMYLGLVATQRKLNGQYPSNRFAGSMLAMGLHILSGMVLIYGGTFMHIQNEVNEVSMEQDQELWREIMYYVYGAFGFLHSLTVGLLMPKVMGEKRITVPIYFGAGVVNFANSWILMSNPSLKAAFTLWGSVNTFIYVRAYIVLLSFAHIDWELLYTYAILAAAATTYPLTVQDVRVYYLLASPIIYAPFHERVCKWFPWLGITEEDWVDGNKPTDKNIPKVTAMLRTYAFDKDYMKKIEGMKNDDSANQSIRRLQDAFRKSQAQKEYNDMTCRSETGHNDSHSSRNSSLDPPGRMDPPALQANRSGFTLPPSLFPGQSSTYTINARSGRNLESSARNLVRRERRGSNTGNITMPPSLRNVNVSHISIVSGDPSEELNADEVEARAIATVMEEIDLERQKEQSSEIMPKAA